MINPMGGGMGMAQPNAPISNGPGGGMPGGQQPARPMFMQANNPSQFNRPGGVNLMGQNPTQANNSQMINSINNGTFGIHTGAPNRQDLVRQYAMAQQLRRAPGF